MVAEHLGVVRDRPAVVTPGPVCVPAEEVGRGVVGVQRQHAVEVRGRRGVVAPSGVGLAAVEPREQVVGVEPEGLGVVGDGPAEVFGAGVGGGPAGVGGGVAGPAANAAVKSSSAAATSPVRRWTVPRWASSAGSFGASRSAAV